MEIGEILGGGSVLSGERVLMGVEVESEEKTDAIR